MRRSKNEHYDKLGLLKIGRGTISGIYLLVFNQNGAALTNSLLVAEKFGKNHFDVTKAIKKLNDSQQNCSQFFVSTTYTDNSGKSNLMYIMNRDGFTLLAMGFTGKKALFLYGLKQSDLRHFCTLINNESRFSIKCQISHKNSLIFDFAYIIISDRIVKRYIYPLTFDLRHFFRVNIDSIKSMWLNSVDALYIFFIS